MSTDESLHVGVTLENVISRVADAVYAADHATTSSSSSTSQSNKSTTTTSTSVKNLYADTQRRYWKGVSSDIEALEALLAEGEVSAAVLACRRRANELVSQQREVLVRMCDDVLRFRKRLLKHLEEWEDTSYNNHANNNSSDGSCRRGGGGRGRGRGGEQSGTTDRYGREPLTRDDHAAASHRAHRSNDSVPSLPPSASSGGGSIGFGDSIPDVPPSSSSSAPHPPCYRDIYLAPFHRHMRRALAEDATKGTWQTTYRRQKTTSDLATGGGGDISGNKGVDGSVLVFQLPIVEPLCAPLGVQLFGVSIDMSGNCGRREEGVLTNCTSAAYTSVSTRVAVETYPADDSGSPGNFQSGGYSTDATVMVLPHLMRPSVAATCRREWQRQQRVANEHAGGSKGGLSGWKGGDVEAVSDSTFDEVHMTTQLKHMLYACQQHSQKHQGVDNNSAPSSAGAKKVLSLDAIEACATALASMIALYDLTQSAESKFAPAKDLPINNDNISVTGNTPAHVVSAAWEAAVAQQQQHASSSRLARGTTVDVHLASSASNTTTTSLDVVRVSGRELLLPHPFVGPQPPPPFHPNSMAHNTLFAHAMTVSKPFGEASMTDTSRIAEVSGGRKGNSSDARVSISDALHPLLNTYHTSLISLCYLDNTSWAISWRYSEQIRRWYCGGEGRWGVEVEDGHRQVVLEGVAKAHLPPAAIHFIADQGLL